LAENLSISKVDKLLQNFVFDFFQDKALFGHGAASACGECMLLVAGDQQFALRNWIFQLLEIGKIWKLITACYSL